VVSAIYDIRTMERDADRDTKKLDCYLENGRWWRDLDPAIPLVVFTSEDLVNEIRGIIGPRPNTHVIAQTFTETLYYQYLDLLTRRQEEYIILNRHPDKDTPLYIILMCNKMYFLERVLEMPEFVGATHAVWVDFGIRHVANHVEQINSWIRLVPDKIRIMAVSPWDRMYPPPGTSLREHDRVLHSYWYHFVAGGLFSGGRVYMQWLVKKFEEYFRRILIAEHYYQNDQVILSMLARDYPDHFSFYFGDYSAIVENYWFPSETLWLIERHVERYHEALPERNPMMDRLLEYLRHHPRYHNYTEHNSTGPVGDDRVIRRWLESGTTTPMVICHAGENHLRVRWMNHDERIPMKKIESLHDNRILKGKTKTCFS